MVHACQAVLCEVARFLLGNNQFVRHVGHITQVLHELAEMLDGMLQRIEGRRQILSSDAVRDWRRHFRAREELPFAAVQHAYRAEAVDIFRAYHFGLAFAREHLGTAASLLNEAAEQRRCWKRGIAILYDAPAPDVGGASRERLVCRMNIKGDRATGDVGQPVIGLAVYHRHRVRECRAVPTLRAFPASQPQVSASMRRFIARFSACCCR
jgi:hypothetical protein